MIWHDYHDKMRELRRGNFSSSFSEFSSHVHHSNYKPPSDKYPLPQEGVACWRWAYLDYHHYSKKALHILADAGYECADWELRDTLSKVQGEIIKLDRPEWCYEYADVDYYAKPDVLEAAQTLYDCGAGDGAGFVAKGWSMPVKSLNAAMKMQTYKVGDITKWKSVPKDEGAYIMVDPVHGVDP